MLTELQKFRDCFGFLLADSNCGCLFAETLDEPVWDALDAVEPRVEVFCALDKLAEAMMVVREYTG